MGRDAARELVAALEGGHRVWVADPAGLPLPAGETHVCYLWYAVDRRERSARLSWAGFRATALLAATGGTTDGGDCAGGTDSADGGGSVAAAMPPASRPGMPAEEASEPVPSSAVTEALRLPATAPLAGVGAVGDQGVRCWQE